MAEPVSTTVIIVKTVATALSDEKVRKSIGVIVAVILSPILVFIAIVGGLLCGSVAHNNATFNLLFYQESTSHQIPQEYKTMLEVVQDSFVMIESEVAKINLLTEHGNGLDSIEIKAVFYMAAMESLDVSRLEINGFVDCFVTYQERTRIYQDEEGKEVEEVYIVALPVALDTAYERIENRLGIAITEETKIGVHEFYTRVTNNGTAFSGNALRGNGSSTEVDMSNFVSPETKNNTDLVSYVEMAWENQWGYVWGTYGQVLTPSLLELQLDQYPANIASYYSFIKDNWLQRPTTDCAGLIKGYGWLDVGSGTIVYGSNGMLDMNANGMYQNATAKGSISTMPETIGLGVWQDGHMGVYIGNGYVIEAMGTKYGVVKTKLEERGWIAWLEIPQISYE